MIRFDPELWRKAWVQSLSQEQKYLYIYLWTNSYTSLAGISHVTVSTIMFETGMDESRIVELLGSMEPEVLYDFESHTAFVVEHFSNQYLGTGKASEQVLKGLVTCLKAVEGHIYVDKFLERYRPSLDPLGWSLDGLKKGVLTAEMAERFERFWLAFPKPRRKDKPLARMAFKELNPSDELLSKIIKAAQTLGRDPYAISTNFKWVKYPGRWLRNRRWEDDTSVAVDPDLEG